MYDELYNILNGFSPAYAAPMSAPLMPATPDGQPAIYLKPDIIDHLGSEIIIAKIINKPFTKNSSPVEYLFAIAVNNRQALEKSLSTIHKNQIAKDNPDAVRELLGHTIYIFDLRFPFFRPGLTPMNAPQDLDNPTRETQKMAFTITNTHLIIGMDSTIEKAIRTANSDITASVISSPWFTRTKTFIPSAGLAALNNDSAEMELLWWSMKSPNKSHGLPFFQIGMPFLLNEMFDTSLLPEFEVIEKYFGCSEIHATSTPDSFIFEFRDIYQPQQKTELPPPGSLN